MDERENQMDDYRQKRYEMFQRHKKEIHELLMDHRDKLKKIAEKKRLQKKNRKMTAKERYPNSHTIGIDR